MLFQVRFGKRNHEDSKAKSVKFERVMNESLGRCSEMAGNKWDWMGGDYLVHHNFTLQSLMGFCEDDYNWTITTLSSRKRPMRQQMSWMLQLFWSILFGAMLLVAIGGNSIVMWIVLAHRRMRTVTNYFLVNLSLADLMMTTLNCMFNFIYMLNNDWHFGRPYCTINNYIANVTVAASVFTLTGISFDRYLAIIRPLKPRMSKLSAHVTILAIWMASLILGLPCIFYSTTITYKANGQTACILVWPDGQPMVSTLDYVYNLVLFLVTYVIPMASMVGCYSAMGRELWGSRSIGELTQRQLDSIKSKRKVVRMFIIIVSIFGICWLPYHSYFLYTHYHSDLVYSQYVQHLYLAFYWLAMSNAMVNPLIYYWMNARFRQYFRSAVCDWRCTRSRDFRSDTAETPPMIRHYSHSYSRSRSGTGDDVMTNERGKVLLRSNKQINDNLLPKHQNTCNCLLRQQCNHQCLLSRNKGLYSHREARDNLQRCIVDPVPWSSNQPGAGLLFTPVELRVIGSSQV